MMIAMNLKIDQLTEKSLVLTGSMEVSSLVPTKPRIGSTSSMNHSQPKFSKLYFPTFEGENPTDWVYKCETFFKYNEVLKHEKVGIASIYLEGKALEWYQGYEASLKELN